jgi:phosphoadenosine phosphosulfate reductase
VSLVRLGKMHLRWCGHCNLPILEAESCGLCDGRTKSVSVTPPGDVRPAFEHDIALIRSLAELQFGPGCGAALVPDGALVLMNKVPGLDRMDEVIMDGTVIGTLRYDLGKGYRLLMRTAAAKAIQSTLTKGYVIAESDAEEFVLKGLNLMAPGVQGVSPEVAAGDEVVVLTPERRALCTGTARMSGQDMTDVHRGQAVKVRWYDSPGEAVRPSRPQDWPLAIRANEATLRARVDEAIGFIGRTVAKNALPAMVSFSGGKDSLACLLLTLDAGLRLPVFFIDTGLELPETVAHVREVAERHGLELIVESAPDDAFFGNLRLFGPPGRDFRWCCKTNKLGPTVRAIMKHYPNGVLSFIGQRRYESEQRSEKPRVWNNPWTPGQVGASPIQDWTALHVWLYIFSRGEESNPWYRRGLDRIGCYLCPASDLAELETLAVDNERLRSWNEYLKGFAKERGLPEEWVTYGLWRWRRIPPSVKAEIEKGGLQLKKSEAGGPASDVGPIRLYLQQGVSPCTMGFSVEGAFTRSLNIVRVANVLNMLGSVELSTEEGLAVVGDVTLFQEGGLIAKAKEKEELLRKVEKVRRAVVKAEECVGCGVCVGRCNEGALTLEQGRVRIDDASCVHCGKCMEPCPAISFGDSEFKL